MFDDAESNDAEQHDKQREQTPFIEYETNGERGGGRMLGASVGRVPRLNRLEAVYWVVPASSP